MFGASQQGQASTGGGLFGSSTQTQPQQTGGLFGGLGKSTQQSGGLFGGLGQNAQQNQQQSSGLFGSVGQNTQTNQSQPQAGGLFGGFGQSTQNQQQPQQTASLFGGNQQAQPGQSTGLFGGIGQQNQQQGGLGQNQQQGGGLFNNSSSQQPGLGQSQQSLQSSLWQPNSGMRPREKSVPDQMAAVLDAWNIDSPGCQFKHYFYNKVEEVNAPFYRPAPNEDPKAWEDALSKKPGPGYIPALCIGFQQLGERIVMQQRNVITFNTRLHQINDSLTALLQKHDTQISIRAMDAKRKHIVIKQRCLALATKVQILQNRGYQLGGSEEDLKIKLMALDKGVNDPGLNARGEEIWARMVTVQERAKLLRAEIEKAGSRNDTVLDEDTDKRAKKILEDYQTQLEYLKKELDKIQSDYEEWDKQQPEAPRGNGR